MTGIEKEIFDARVLLADWGLALARDQLVALLLDEYRESITRTHDAMRQGGVFDTCSACAARTGSCCFREIEESYDAILLLINLLLGEELPGRREIPGGCMFVGGRGCKLMARYSFCVSYICPELKTRLDPSATSGLLSRVGDELYKGWETELAIRSWLKARGVV